MRTLFVSLFLVLSATCAVQSARILGIFPLPGKSHYFLGNALMKALAENGHDVTMISPFSEKNPPNNGSYRDVVLTGMLDEVKERRKEINMFEFGDINPFISIPVLSYLMSEIGEMALKHENVQKLINSGEKFDAVIVEQFFNDAHKALATHFGGVLILFNAIGANYWVNPLVGNPAPPSYIPDSFLSFCSEMSFCERLQNSLAYILQTVIHHFYLYPKQNRVVQKYIPNAPNLDDILYNASLILLNSHPSLNQAVPHVSNMVEIGGFHVRSPKKLPEELQEFLDGAQDGAIYFSMGSNLRSSDLPVEKREALLKAFSKLKQKVLWKWEDDFLPKQPKNVKLSKWFPQQEILAHPNIKLFITHGGLLSTTETVYFGVPVLAIPIYGDQKLNAQTAVNHGFGLILPYRDVSENSLTEKLNEILSNPKYMNSAKKQSNIFHDRQVSAIETAIYWVNYVIEHKGAPHLRIAALNLPWYKYFLLDVIVFVSTTFFIITTIFWIVLKRIFSRKRTHKIKTN